MEDKLGFPFRVKTYLGLEPIFDGELLSQIMETGESRTNETPTQGVRDKPSLRMRNRGYLWIAASAISDVTLFGWEFQYLHLALLDRKKAQQIFIRTRCIHRVQPEDIDFKAHFRGWIGAQILETILPMIQDLPNLRTFKLKQDYDGRDPKAHQAQAQPNEGAET